MRRMTAAPRLLWITFKLSDEAPRTAEALFKNSELMADTVDYAKTRPVFDGYKAARYSKKYLAQH